MKWSNLKGQQWGGSTLPMNHDGEFFNIELKVGSISVSQWGRGWIVTTYPPSNSQFVYGSDLPYITSLHYITSHHITLLYITFHNARVNDVIMSQGSAKSTLLLRPNLHSILRLLIIFYQDHMAVEYGIQRKAHYAKSSQ